MSTALTDQILTALAEFSSTSRLYGLAVGELEPDALMLEAFAAHEAVNEVGVHELIVLSTSAHLDIASLLGLPAWLDVSLANGSRTRFAGEISAAAMLGTDGGLARYRLRMSPWLWRLEHVRNSRVWQERSVIEIVDSVFEAYRPQAKWRWSEDTGPFMAEAPSRSYCCQYRETDLDFVSRLLAEEGLGWRIEQTEDGPVLVIFANSCRPCAVPEDPSSERDGGIRYHGVSAVEEADTIQALTTERRLHASLLTVLSADYKAKRVVGASSPTRLSQSDRLPALEMFDVPGQYAFANQAQARRYADLRMEGVEAGSQSWRGRSSVRTLRAGTRVTVNEMPLRPAGRTPAFAVLRVWSVGVNNMPPQAQQALAELFGPVPALLEDIVANHMPDDFALAIAQARATGYANCFEAVAAELPWRPPVQSKPTAHGAQTAIVIGADGSDHPAGADELYCDRLGRVRIRFHWQDRGDASCWVRVAQRSAGSGMGSQFLPRIGQEVLVQFLENDIDRPVIVGAVYNGRGEGGIAPTPGGSRDARSDISCFERAHDHAVSGQGNLTGGHSPVWHGASGDIDGHRNGAAQWGIRSKEFGGSGYNQLVFDDTDGQGRVQLKSSHAATELNLGHLIHAADNYRGSFRGLGAELRTDGYGAVRAGAGLLISSFAITHGKEKRDPVGENAAGVALLKQASALAKSFDSAARTHLSVGLAAHAGAAKANASVLSDKAAPLEAMVEAASATTGEGEGEPLPHFGAPLIGITAKDGFAASAGQSMQLANGETVTLMSGQGTQFVIGEQTRVHSGQAFGMLGGAVKAGEDGIGLQIVAANDAIDLQAQCGELKVQARDQVDVISANGHIDWAAAKSISLSTAGGANILIDGGNIVVQCPGKISIKAGKKSFLGPEKLAYPMPALPRSVCVECLKKSLAAGPAFTMVQ